MSFFTRLKEINAQSPQVTFKFPSKDPKLDFTVKRLSVGEQRLVLNQAMEQALATIDADQVDNQKVMMLALNNRLTEVMFKYIKRNVVACQVLEEDRKATKEELELLDNLSLEELKEFSLCYNEACRLDEIESKKNS